MIISLSESTQRHSESFLCTYRGPTGQGQRAKALAVVSDIAGKDSLMFSLTLVQMLGAQTSAGTRWRLASKTILGHQNGQQMTRSLVVIAE